MNRKCVVCGMRGCGRIVMGFHICCIHKDKEHKFMLETCGWCVNAIRKIGIGKEIWL